MTASSQDFAERGRSMRLKMPGKSHRGDLPELTDAQRRLVKALQSDVASLAADIGERNVYRYDKLAAAERFLAEALAGAGYAVERQAFTVRGRQCANLIVELAGGERAKEIIVVGGHYDSVPGSPGANDNASGAAAVLAMARALAGARPGRTVRMALFTNEEPPWFQTEDMGSVRYADQCKAREENIVAMLSLETIGYYSDEPRSQKYPLPFSLIYPSTGNFIGFVSDVESGPLTAAVCGAFRRHARFPSYGAAIPARIEGAGWSDHWSFWQAGYRAAMVTDTAPFRYPHYHLETDTPDKIDFERMARVVEGVIAVVGELALIEPGAAESAATPPKKLK